MRRLFIFVIGLLASVALLSISARASLQSQDAGIVLPLPTGTLLYFPQVDGAPPAPDSAADVILIPAGSFQMGCDASHDSCNTVNHDELPRHTVTLSAYSIEKHEVTNARYQACVDAGGCTPPQKSNSVKRDSYYGNPAYGDYPVIYVNWNQAVAFCTWAGKRLPTEAEWEMAARGTDGRIYPWGNAAPDKTMANYNESGVGDTTQVGSYPMGASPYGVMDMAGNVWEWTADWYDSSYYSGSPGSNPTGPAMGTNHVLRGGSWNFNRYIARSVFRFSDLADLWYYDFVGIRCAGSQ